MMLFHLHHTKSWIEGFEGSKSWKFQRIICIFTRIIWEKRKTPIRKIVNAVIYEPEILRLQIRSVSATPTCSLPDSNLDILKYKSNKLSYDLRIKVIGGVLLWENTWLCLRRSWKCFVFIKSNTATVCAMLKFMSKLQWLTYIVQA